MTQQETAEKAAVARLLAAVDNLNASWDEVHRLGLVVQVQNPVVELNDGKRKFNSVRTQVAVFRKIN